MTFQTYSGVTPTPDPETILEDANLVASGALVTTIPGSLKPTGDPETDTGS